jgi:hypothetical protein
MPPLGDFLNPALALLGQGLKKSPIGKKLDFANHPYLCKGLVLLYHGDKIIVTVSLSETVVVTGEPTYTISIGGVNKSATYVSTQGLKKSPIGKKLDFANHPYLCKGLGLLYHLKACNCIFARFC